MILIVLESLLSKAIRLTIAACSALLVTLYVLKDWDVELEAVFAVAHSPFAGASPQDFDCGAIWISWASVRKISSIASEQGASVAVEEKANDRTSDMARIECMALSRT
jgi:hypothetical protein